MRKRQRRYGPDRLAHLQVPGWGLWCRRVEYKNIRALTDDPVTCWWCIWLQQRSAYARMIEGYA